MHYLLSLVLCSTGTLFGMHHINTSLTQFQPDSFVQQVKKEKDKEQKEILQIKTNYNKARKKDTYIQSISGVSGNHQVVQWFERDILSNIAQSPLIDARKQLQKVPSAAWYKHLKSKGIQQCPSTLLIALPDELIAREVTPFLFDGNMQATDAFNMYTQKHGIGKTLEIFSLINQSKGIKPLSITDSFTLYCNSPETYMLCKRLMPEFNKQNKKEFKQLELNEQRKLVIEQDVRVSRKEQRLLKQYLSDPLRDQLKEYYVIPEKTFSDALLFEKDIRLCGGTCLVSAGISIKAILSTIFNNANAATPSMAEMAQHLGIVGLSAFGCILFMEIEKLREENFNLEYGPIVHPRSLQGCIYNGYKFVGPKSIKEVLQ